MRFLDLRGLVLATLVAALSFAACSSDEQSAPSSAAGSTVGGAAARGGEGGASGAEGGASGSSGAGALAGDAGAAGAPVFVPPSKLSETGLYTEIESDTLAPGVLEYAPAYELWSDGAEKRRWVYLPPGTTIDSSNMDFWSYPVGTKLWKEFSRDSVRVETRLLYKYEQDQWFLMAFEWNDAQTDALAAPDGHENAGGTEHDIPDRFACRECHQNMPDRVLGFSAVQLSHSGAGVTLEQLIADGRLSDPPSQVLSVPGDDTERTALGYLHANCGVCHNDGGKSDAYETVKMELWLHAESLGDVQGTPTYLTTIDQPTQSFKGTDGLRVVAGNLAESMLYERFTTSDAALHMPPLASEITDPTGQQTIGDWISALP